MYLCTCILIGASSCLHFLHTCVHHLCICAFIVHHNVGAPASANHGGSLCIRTTSFHHIISQSQAVDVSQNPAGLTRTERSKKKREEEKILTHITRPPFLFLPSLCALHKLQTPESTFYPAARNLDKMMIMYINVMYLLWLQLSAFKQFFIEQYWLIVSLHIEILHPKYINITDLMSCYRSMSASHQLRVIKWLKEEQTVTKQHICCCAFTLIII